MFDSRDKRTPPSTENPTASPLPYPRQSPLGEHLKIVADGFAIKLADVRFREVPSTLKLGAKEQETIAEFFKAAREKNPHFFDGTLWRTETVDFDSSSLIIYVSPTRYSAHNVLRSFDREPGQYPDPITINTLQRTSDGYLLLGVRGSTADQTGIDLLGAGFIFRRERRDGSSHLPDLQDTMINECYDGGSDRKKGETDYLGIKRMEDAFDPSQALAFAVLTGRNRDSTIAILNQLKLPLDRIAIPDPAINKEHAALVPVKDTKEEIRKVLEAGKINGIEVSDITLGVLEAYLRSKELGILQGES